MSSSFYKKFEDKHRGSPELIKNRLKVYLPFINPFKKIFNKDELKIVDFGCGRGEWLELVKENGFIELGVDIDQDMISECKNKDLKVIKSDAIKFIQDLEDESCVAVTGFHIAEHLLFEDLVTLIKESLRILKPAGLLILETPNPENIVVGTVNFWLDPTHKRPLPPQLLSFLVEYSGFSRYKILRLQEQKGILEKNNITILDVLSGVSPDYSIVAQKKGPEHILKKFDECFNRNYGVELGSIANKYQSILQSKIDELSESNQKWQQLADKLTGELSNLRLNYQAKEKVLQSKIDELLNQNSLLQESLNLTEQKIREKDKEIQQKNSIISDLRSKIDKIQMELHQVRQLSDNREKLIIEQEKLINSIYQSKSWKIATILRRFKIKKSKNSNGEFVTKQGAVLNSCDIDSTYQNESSLENREKQEGELEFQEQKRLCEQQFEDLLNAAKCYIDKDLDMNDLYPFKAEELGCLKITYGGYDRTQDNYNWTKQGGWLGKFDENIGIGINAKYKYIKSIIEKYSTLAEKIFFPYPEIFSYDKYYNDSEEGLLLVIFSRDFIKKRKFIPVKEDVITLLSPRAKKIYNDLKEIINKNKMCKSKYENSN